MKNLIYYLLIITFAIVSCNNVSKEETKKAYAYNNNLVNYTSPVIANYNSLVGSTKSALNNSMQGNLSASEIEEIQKEFNNLNTLIENNLGSLRKLNEFDEEIKFKEASIKYLTICKDVLNNEYKELLTNIQKEMTQDNALKSGKLVLTILEKLMNSEKETKAIQKQFAEKYKFNIGEDPQDWEAIEKQINAYKKSLEQAE